ncbi:MAG: GTP-binding protein [Nitrososphaerota archaeon]|jgi:small GTP-binding protein|nr:GTP-binding protein [Nitrososphaerota archaeon]
MDDLNQLKETLRTNRVIFEEISISETEVKKLQKLSKTTLILNNQGELWAIKLYTNTQINQILHTLSNYKYLKYIDICQINLKTLPSELQKLTSLQTLNISNNRLTVLPDWLPKLTGLWYIDISHNSFQTLPFVLLPFLQKLNASTEELLIKDVPSEFITQGWAAIEQHYIENRQELQKSDIPHLAELKVMIIGNGSSGKTCISKALKDKQNYKHTDHTDEPATEGIELRDVEHVFRQEKWLFRMWDLGGQAAYAATQSMFMTDQTLYLVVMDARTEKQPDIYLHYIQTIAPESPIIIMINKVDQNKWFGLNKQLYVGNSEYCHVQEDIVRFSCAEDCEKHGAELFNAIEKVLSNTYYGFRSKQWVPKWLKVKNDLMDYLATKNNGYITINEYKDICAKNELSEDVYNTILIGCEKLGMVFAPIAKDSSVAYDWVMHAEWITKGINLLFKLEPAVSYKKSEIFAHMENSKNSYKYTRMETSAILDCLKKEELAFEDSPTSTIIIPALLPTDEPNNFPKKEDYQMWHLPDNGDLLKSTNSEIRFRYPFLHPKIKQVFMVKLYQDLKKPVIYNYGAYWRQDGLQVVMMEDNNDIVFYLHAENEEKYGTPYATLCEVQKDIQKIMHSLHEKHHIKKMETITYFPYWQER